MAPFAAKRAVSRPRERSGFFTFTPPIPPTPPPPTYLLRGPLGRSKPDLPTYCIGSNRGGQTPYLGRSRNPERTLASTWQGRCLHIILLVASARAPSHPHGDQEGLGREVCHCAAAQQRLPVRRWPQRRLPQVGRSPPCLARGPGARHARFSPSASSPRAPPTCRRAARVARGPP